MPSKEVRYAVVGLGHISQVAVLPAFEHASRNSELSALVSDDKEKLRKLGKKYDVANSHGYDDYEALLASGEIDAVYIALPNSLHKDFAIKAARAGVHVLCEKPMAVTAEQCRAMIDAAEANGVKLMIAYRLHFEKINMEVAELVRRGVIGEPRFFASSFSQSVVEGDVRLMPLEKGGGSVYDMG
ncbi:MAG: Gfo/Idh/MocA family oxidoreductase, partial [Acidobacteria bacterium]|nr:Gfo/Idh/MocA family oxidoreductase [Acidobacteriota bacterium]